MNRSIRLGVLLALLTATTSAAAWQSQLYRRPAGSNQFQTLPVEFGGRTWQLQDYSYAGYRLGGAPLASDIPCNNLTVSATGDITDELQAAVDTVGQSGGGMVQIPAGTYTLSRPISVPYSNVGIQGAGSRKTTLRVAAQFDSNDGVFTLGKRADGWSLGWIEQGRLFNSDLSRSDVTAVVREGATTLTVASGLGVSAGQWIMVRQYFWQGLSNQGSGGAWRWFTGFPNDTNNKRGSLFGYLRQVVAVAGNQVTLDAPIPYTLDPANNPIKLSDTASPSYFRPMRNLGVAGVTIRFADNQTGAGGRPGGAAVHAEGLIDGWIYDVQAFNVPQYGFHLLGSARVAVYHSLVSGAQDYSGGWAYGVYVESSQNVLVRKVRVEDVRQGFTLRDPMSSSVVFQQSQSAGSRLGDDTHHTLSHGLLWDQHELTYGSSVQGTYRGGNSGGAHETVANIAFWNAKVEDSRGDFWGGALLLNPASTGWGIVVGGTASAAPVFEMDRNFDPLPRIPANDGLQVGPVQQSPGAGSVDRNVLYEGLHRTDALSPASLYVHQLRQRTGLLPAEYAVSDCRAAPLRGAWARIDYRGPGTLIYNGEQLGYAYSEFNCGAGCDRDAAAPDASGGVKSFKLRYAAGNSLLSILRGRTLNTRTQATLQLRIRPVGTAIQSLRFELAQHVLPEGSQDLARGGVTVNGLVADQWNTVRIPLSQYTAGDFNQLTVRAPAGNLAGDVYLDDIVVLPPA